MRLINADALGIGKANRAVFDTPAYADGWNSAIEMIANAPTIDAVPVVRCKDCKEHRDVPNCEEVICKRYNTFKEPLHFCSYGERRSDENRN